jgi:GT2 family glycosyltransferase
VELGWRAWLLGYKVMIIPNSKVSHLGGQTVKNFSKIIAFHGTKNYLSLVLTHFEITQIFKIFLKLGIMIFSEKFKSDEKFKENSQISFNIPDFRTSIRAFLWVVKNLKNILKKRNEIQSNKICTNQDLRKMNLITK